MSEQNDKIAFNLLSIYFTIYHTYRLLYCKGHIHTFNVVILLLGTIIITILNVCTH